MPNDRLNILATPKKRSRKEETIYTFDKKWQEDPRQFDPFRNAMSRMHLERTWTLIKESLDFKNKRIADLGCGKGALARRMASQGAKVDAVDIATPPLKELENIENLKPIQDYVPHTKLNDEEYDLILSTELIGYLHPEQYRLYFSEMARIMQRKGRIICSTPLDIYSSDALQRFNDLIETEFKIEKWVFSYHALYIRILHFLKFPSNLAKAKKFDQYRKKELQKRKKFYKFWFQINSTKVLGTFWQGISYLLKPLVNLFSQNEKILLSLEKMTRFLLSDNGISHAIFLGEMRVLFESENNEKIPEEKKHKKEVWE